jgi:hypothetical protein
MMAHPYYLTVLGGIRPHLMSKREPRGRMLGVFEMIEEKYYVFHTFGLVALDRARMRAP